MASGMRNELPSTSPAITTPMAMIDIPMPRSFSVSLVPILPPGSQFVAPLRDRLPIQVRKAFVCAMVPQAWSGDAHSQSAAHLNLPCHGPRWRAQRPRRRSR